MYPSRPAGHAESLHLAVPAEPAWLEPYAASRLAHVRLRGSRLCSVQHDEPAKLRRN